jgi:hypothetical protein
MHVAGALQANLRVRIFLADIGLARNADRNVLIADGNGHGILVVAVQND